MGRGQQCNRKRAVVSFSGIDGAGKSTQIDIFCTRLREAALHIRMLAFWDDVAALTSFRQFTSHTLFRSEKGVGAPGQPVNRRDKNIQSWYMTPVRFLLYLLDGLSLCITVARARASHADVVVFDRYLYDELANLPLDRVIPRAYVRLLLRICPRPDIAYWIDADPAAARERKPEYPLEFLHRSRNSYVALAELAGMTVMEPGPAHEVAARVMQTFLKQTDQAVTPRLTREGGQGDEPFSGASPDFSTSK
jgi:thymidylate kinase